LTTNEIMQLGIVPRSSQYNSSKWSAFKPHNSFEMTFINKL